MTQVSCGGGGSGQQASGGTINQPPTISGSPPATAVAGTPYAFAPSAQDPKGGPLTFSITNLPSWAKFDVQTGMLSGTPTAADTGVYRNIGISVSDGTSVALLPEFSITVSAAAGFANLSWVAPTENEDGSPIQLAGYRVFYGDSPSQLGTALFLPDPAARRYTVTGLTPGAYYFAVSAYDASGAESSLSNIAAKTIP